MITIPIYDKQTKQLVFIHEDTKHAHFWAANARIEENARFRILSNEQVRIKVR